MNIAQEFLLKEGLNDWIISKPQRQDVYASDAMMQFLSDEHKRIKSLQEELEKCYTEIADKEAIIAERWKGVRPVEYTPEQMQELQSCEFQNRGI